MPSRPDPLLRAAVLSDAARLAPLRADVALQQLLMANPDPVPPTDVLADTGAWIARREGAGWFRVIDPGQGAAGFVQIYDTHRKNRYGWLGLALLPLERGRGLGPRALAEAELLAKAELDLRKLLLQVRADNATAIAVYDRAGWRRAGLLLGQYDDGARIHDVMIYEKALG